MSTNVQPASGPGSEPVWTLVIGLLLGALGVVSYTGAVPYFGSGQSSSWTPLIPALFGAPLLLLGLLALKERFLKHAMHAAAMVGLLGLLGSLGMVVPKLPAVARGEALERPEAFHSQVAMAALCGVFVVVCVRSFIAARKRPRK